MSGRKKHHEEEEAGEAWLLPYSDLMTLLLAVFIVLWAVSQIDPVKATEMAASFEGIMTGGKSVMVGEGTSIIPLYVDTVPANEGEGTGEGEGGGTGEGAAGAADGTEEKNEELFPEGDYESLEKVREDLETYFEEKGLEQDIVMHIDERGLVISLSSTLLFDSGSVEIKKENEEELLTVANMINELDNHIRIEGHTDNMPINTAIYPSNWELSAARAAQVVKLFASHSGIHPEKMVVTGYGEFKPVADNRTPEGRARNRRIDIIIMNKKYNSLENQIEDITMID